MGRKLEPFVSAQTAAGVSANPSASSGAIEADARTASPAQTPAGRSRAAGCRVSSCDSMQKLARSWHLHRTTVATHLRRCRGCSSASRHPERAAEGEAERLYGEEWSCQRLAERYGCDDETVRLR
jgi:hypothetical protein